VSLRVPVCGVGVIAPGATGREGFAAMLREGRSAVAPVERFDVAGLRASTAALVTDFRPREFIPAMKMRRMSGLSRLGYAAAKLAVDEAGLQSGAARDRIGVSVGSTFGPVKVSVDYLSEYVAKGPALAPPQLFAESVANAPGSHIAIEFALRGFNMTFTQREGSALTAIAQAASQIARGAADAAIAGGVEEMDEMVFSVLDRIGALAHAAGGSEEKARPFDRRRNGVVAGEGSAMFALGSGAWSAEPIAAISGVGYARDKSASISDWGSRPEAPAGAMQRAIDDAGLALGDIDAIWASANSSVRGDRLEAEALTFLFGQAIPPVVAVKGCFGEYAAAGALQFASAVLAIGEQAVPPSQGFELPDAPALPVTREYRQLALRHVLVNALSAGGGVVSLVLSSPTS
jgi:3-oxoacyl-[acyl-carrier-protein] synthase II